MDKKFCPYCMNPVKEGETCTNCGLTEGVYTPRDHHLPLGSVLNDRYLVGRVLGEGGFGITYIGCDLNLEMKVAIKEYFPIDRVYRLSKASMEVSNYAHAAEKFHSGKVKFLQEARTMARLDKQQNIVSVRDFFEKNNTAYIVMEYVEGTTLKELVHQRGGRIPAGELLYMLEPLFLALTSVHEMGLIHRDISPDNLMLENGKIKLLDFGCARESASQSETMTIALKQGYAPIEQYQHKGQGPWTDVYALSATIYYCLTGKTPQSAVDRLNEEELVPPRRLGVDLTAGQEAALLKGMSVKAKDRFQSVEELFAALYTNVIAEPIPAKPTAAEPAPAKSVQAEFVRTESISAETLVSESASDVSVSGTDSGAEEKIRNAVPDNDDTSNPVVALDSSEIDRDQKPSGKGRILEVFPALRQQLMKRNPVIILAGCAVLLVAVICIVWAVIPSKDDTEVTYNPNGAGTSTDDPQPENQDDPVKELETVETPFADAVVLEDVSKKGLQDLMEDDTVSAIIIKKETVGNDKKYYDLYGSITITKPVLVEGFVSLNLFDMLTVKGENASLWVNGELTGDFILQTADGGKVVVDEGSVYSGLLWLEDQDDVRILPNGDLSYDNLIIAGKNTLFQRAVPVRDEASLRQAIDEGEAVIICEDITVKTMLYSTIPILIEEGVTVTMQGNGSLIGAGDGFCLWNEGSILGGVLQTGTGDNDVDKKIINYGEISVDFLNLSGVVVNLGDLKIDNIWTEYMSSRIYNIETLRFQSEESRTLNICLTNYGSVILNSSQNTSAIHITAEVDNYGEIRIEEGNTQLQSYLLNMSNGRVVICDDATLQNRGVIEVHSGSLVCESEGVLENEEGAVFEYYGGLNVMPESGWVHLVNDGGDSDPDRVSNVYRALDLYAALQDPEIDKIYLRGAISWNYDELLTLTKEMDIVDGAALLMQEGSELILDGGFLINHGSVKVDRLTLTHGSSLDNSYGTIELYGPESVIKLGNAKGEGDYGGTDCLMNDHGEILHSCKIELYDGALMIQKGYLEGPMFHIQDHAYAANLGEIQWGDEGYIEISGEGQFHNLVQQDWSRGMSIQINKDGTFRSSAGLVLQSGDIRVEQGGRFESSLTDLTLGNDLSVMNYGYFSVDGGGDSAFLQGYFENYGTLYIGHYCGFVINAPDGAAQPACLDNQGKVVIGGSKGDADSYGYIRCENGEFIGNAATYTGF